MNVDPSGGFIKLSSSDVTFVDAVIFVGHTMLHEKPPSGRGTVVEYKIIGNMRTTEMHHAIIDTNFEINGVRNRGELIGWQTAMNLNEKITNYLQFLHILRQI